MALAQPRGKGVSPATASVGPSRSAKPSRLDTPCSVSATPAAATIPPPTRTRSLRPRGGGSGRSRIARMMFSLLTRRLVPTMVASATTNPIANARARLLGSSVK